MKRTKVYHLLLIVVLFSGCTQNKPAITNENDTKEIHELLRQYRHGANTGDLDLFISSWADDAIRMESDFHAIIGKEKIREHFTIPFDMFDIKITIYGEEEVEAHGDLAYGWGNYVLSLTAKGTDSTTHFDGKFFDVYKRQADGSWKIYIDCVTSNPKWTNESVLPDFMQDESQADPIF